ncbi:MAG: proton-conducting transporter membrane subunit [Eubacteriales bacterium]|nr:proton-conducting transporter membrane subunit [Eubacteriales bacterium]
MNMILAILVFYPFLGGLLSYLTGRYREDYRNYLAEFVAVSEFALAVLLAWMSRGSLGAETIAQLHIPEICGFGLDFTLDGFRVIYSLVAALMWMMTTLLSGEYFRHHDNKNRFYLFLLLTLGATMGVFLSADLYTTFIFFEVMSFTSYVWVAQEENAASLRAAATYLAVAVIGGLVMLMGLFLLYHAVGTLEISELPEAVRACEDKNVLYAAGACMLVGFGAKAGAFPLHIWLPKAHPVAPAPASALLSGILTKTGIFGILVISSNLFLYDEAWGNLILGIGVLTMFGGALLAVFSIDLKRTLACSSMSQIGFILVGVGMQGLLGEENALAVHGTLLHMVNHSMIKLVLFMAAGVIFMNTHALNLNEIRGFGRKKPLLKAIFLVGALAIGGIPLFGGYISKTLLHESIVEYGGGWVMRAVEYIFLFSGGLTVAYMTKLFAAIFVEKNASAEVQRKFDHMKGYMNGQSTFALAGSAVLLLIWGLFPHTIMDRAAAIGQGLMHLEEEGHMVAYFSFQNLFGGAVSIGIGAVVYFLVIRRYLMRTEGEKARKGTGACAAYADAWPAWLDLENLIYRPLLLQFLPFICGVACRIADSFVDLSVVVLRRTIYSDSPLPHERTEGNAFTERAGKLLNGLQGLGNRLWNRKNPGGKDFVHILAVRYEEFTETNKIIRRSLSFGLMLFGIGLCLTLVYIIWW